MLDQDRFETNLERRLRAMTDPASRAFDAGAIARFASVGSRTRSGALDVLFGRPRARAFAPFLLAALALAALAALVGTRTSPPAGILAIFTDQGVLFAEADGSNARVVLQSPSYRSGGWSPDGRYLAVSLMDPSAIEGRVVVLDVTGVEVGGFTVEQRGGDQGIHWAPDSEHLVVDRGAGDLDLVRIDGTVTWSTKAPVAAGQEWRQVRTAAWSPDRQWIAADLRREANLCHETILVSAVRPSHAASLFRDSEATLDCSPHAPAWSPDGRHLAMLRSDQDCWPWGPASPCDLDLVVYDSVGPSGVMPFQGVEPRAIARSLAPGTRPLWMPSGEELLVARRLDAGRDAATQLVMVNADGSGERVVTSLGTEWPAFEWAVPGRSVTYHVRAIGLDDSDPQLALTEIRLYDLATGEDRQLAPRAFAAVVQPLPSR